jgi:outer membrane protein
MNPRSSLAAAALVLGGILLALLIPRPTTAADLHIAVVNVQKAINESESGKQSRKVLEDEIQRRQTEFKAKETQIRKMEEETRTSMMLSDAAKADREKEFRQKEADFRQEVQNAQADVQQQQRKFTDAILVDLKRIIAIIAKEKKYDIVLEHAAADVMLYTSFKYDDITADVIDRYNKEAKKASQ